MSSRYMYLDVNRLKVTLRLALNRLKLIREKTRTQSRVLRREVAKDLENDREGSARVKVEKIIREDYYFEALEMLENYCDLLIARIDLIDSKPECDKSIRTIVVSVIYSSTRAGVKELDTVRDLLAIKYGREFITDALEDRSGEVDQKLKSKLDISPPDESFVTSYLTEIARGYRVNWRNALDRDDDEDDNGSGSGSGGEKEPVKAREASPMRSPVKAEGTKLASSDLLDKLPSTPPSKKLSNKVALAQDGLEAETSPVPKKGSQKNDDDTPSLEELLGRFEALKRR
ncbi:Vacuolar protein sorting-associated protein ist1 [Spiromyces aspiralis]|uniref:Vacuolar protein sorting-associated protein ist1 n=1 Tax=Spiromyces aspiralis TaxID=68401 RepID=A0ACC1HQH7_9FUNG|nr:Vacuolar protein sorting-associated protein ist1 [Spiromyces aspiralis]